MIRIATTKAQRDALDAAVFAAVVAGETKSSDLVQCGRVVAVLGSLPLGRSDMRYVDGALQRLRKARQIKAAGSRWFAAKRAKRGPRRAS